MAENKIAIDGAPAAGGALPVTGTFVPSFRTSAAAGATSAAPTAGTAVATIASGSLPAGLYDVEVTVGMNGTLAAADTSNLTLKAGATTLVPKLTYVANATSNPTATFRLRASLDGVSALTVTAVASATASSVYSATIIATQVN
jgi:hypothetical protein